MQLTGYGVAPAGQNQPEPPRTMALPSSALPLAVAAPLLLSFVGGLAAVVSFWVSDSKALVGGLVSAATAAAAYTIAKSVSARYGTGRLREDFAIYARPSDVLRAVGFALVAQVTVGVVSVAVAAVDEEFAGGNLKGIDLRGNPAATAVLVLAAVVIAPIMEEVVFRGILLQALRSRLAAPVAVVVQAVIFSLVHLGAYGKGNVSVVAGTASIGVVLGVVAVRDGRLGTVMFTHAIYNAAALGLAFVLT